MSEVKDKLITAENLKNAYDDNKRAITELKGDLSKVDNIIEKMLLSIDWTNGNVSSQYGEPYYEGTTRCVSNYIRVNKEDTFEIVPSGLKVKYFIYDTKKVYYPELTSEWITKNTQLNITNDGYLLLLVGKTTDFNISAEEVTAKILFVNSTHNLSLAINDLTNRVDLYQGDMMNYSSLISDISVSARKATLTKLKSSSIISTTIDDTICIFNGTTPTTASALILTETFSVKPNVIYTIITECSEKIGFNMNVFAYLKDIEEIVDIVGLDNTMLYGCSKNARVVQFNITEETEIRLGFYFTGDSLGKTLIDVPMRLGLLLGEFSKEQIWKSESENAVLTERLPILYLSGDIAEMSKDNAVTLMYNYGELSGDCTVKWQGSSSLSYPKKNYTIKFNNPMIAQENWGLENKYCMKANWIDASHARNVVSAKLWGQIVKSRVNANERLNVLPNGGAIDGFPVVIMINNEFEGLYTFNIPKDRWMFGMGSGTNEAILCADDHVLSTNFHELATLDGDFKLEYVTDEYNSEWVLTSVNTLINACINSDGTDLDTTIAQYLDWDSAIDYYIFVCLLCGRDMFDKNYLLSTFDGTKWFFSAYDMDSVFGLQWDGKAILSAKLNPSFGSFAYAHRLMWLILNYKKDKLKARYAELRADVMSEDNVATVFANFIGSIPKEVYSAEQKKWATLPNTSVNGLHQITDWYRRRVAIMDAEIEAL